MDMQTKGNVNCPLELDVKDLDLKNKEKLNGTVTIEKDANNKYTYTYDITDNEYKIYGTKDSEIYEDLTTYLMSTLLIQQTESQIIVDSKVVDYMKSNSKVR